MNDESMTRYRTPHSIPEDELRELLVILAEEAGEIVIAASKALRFGLADGYPGAETNNAQDIAREVGDLVAVVGRLQKHGICSDDEIMAAVDQKNEKLDVFMQCPAPGEVKE